MDARDADDEHRAALFVRLTRVFARRLVFDLYGFQRVARAAGTGMAHDRFLVLADLPTFRQLCVPRASEFE